MKLYALGPRWQVVICCVLLCAMAFVSCEPPLEPEESTDSSASVIEYSPESDALVLSFRQTGGLIHSPDAPPLLRIYGDGRALIHLPAGSRRAGDYSLQLAQSELADLLESLSDRGVMTLQPDDISTKIKEALEERAKIQRGPAVRRMIVDDVTTVFEIRLERYAAAGSQAPPQADFHSAFSFYALQQSAKEFEEVVELQQLAAAERELLRLATREDAVPIRP